MSHIGANVPDFVPTTFPTSYGDPQTVEVNVRRALGPVTANWQVDGVADASTVRDHASSPAASATASRVSTSTACAGRSRASAPGDRRSRVWFEAGGKRSDPFTFTVRRRVARNPVLVLAAEDYTGQLCRNRRAGAPARPTSARTSRRLADAGIGADVFDIDAQGRNHAGSARRAQPLRGRDLVLGP